MKLEQVNDQPKTLVKVKGILFKILFFLRSIPLLSVGGMMRFSLVILLFFSFAAFASGQVKLDTVRLSRVQAEELFIKQNLLLIAQKLNIDQAEALVQQAKLWPNPNITIDEVNLWARESQSMGDDLPPLFGNFGRNQQIGIQLEQLVLTAGKRRKLVAMEQVSADMSRQYFEDLLRNLKMEFRYNLYDLQYYQKYRRAYSGQLSSIKNLLSAYRAQVARGNIGQGEYTRLKALELEISRNLIDLDKEINEVQKELKILLNLPFSNYILLEIAADAQTDATIIVNQLSLESILEDAIAQRPDLKIAALEQSYFTKMHAYERALRVPDLNFNGNYDRGGNFLMNFVGIGVSVDLPVFNRNQGNIRYAKVGMEKTKILYEEMTSRVQSEVIRVYQDFLINYDFQLGIEAGYEAELDKLLEAYAKSFRERNISMLEYLDFLGAYLENKEIIINSERELNKSIEEIRFITGKELN